jgi:alkaline phosphatase
MLRFLWLLLGSLSLVRSFITAHFPPKSVILMISDGFGPASETMARDYVSTMFDSKVLPLDAFLKGSSRTRSYSSPITDSAAGATAFSCGIKSYNAAIAVVSGLFSQY